MRKRYILILLLIPLVLLPSYFYYSYALNLPNSKDSEQVPLTIESGESVAEIAAHLNKKGLIRSAALFQLYVALNDLSKSLQAGRYLVPRNLTVKEVVAVLSHGTFEEKITFIEGWRREEYADAISNSQFPIFNSVDFLRETEGLEGYLFPDTYFVSKETTAEDLVRLMRENFDKKTKDLPNNSGLSLEDAVIIASIVEREVGDAQDKPIVAAILIKRYLNGWALQADATVQYALGFQEGRRSPEASREGGWWKKNLTEDDLKTDSPYNTYLHSGLPPTPICNPGLDSLRAVFDPPKTEYWYYLSDKNGQLHYAVTNEEHNRNVADWLR